MSPPILSHPLLVVTESWVEFPESYSKLPLAIYLHMVMHRLPCYTLHLSHPLSPPLHPASVHKECAVHMYYEILLSHRKEHI